MLKTLVRHIVLLSILFLGGYSTVSAKSSVPGAISPDESLKELIGVDDITPDELTVDYPVISATPALTRDKLNDVFESVENEVEEDEPDASRKSGFGSNLIHSVNAINCALSSYGSDNKARVEHGSYFFSHEPLFIVIRVIRI